MGERTLRLTTRGDRLSVEVLSLDWVSPYEAVATWLHVADLPRHPTLSEVRAAYRAIWNNADYFAVCISCGKRFAQGRMTSEGDCHNCAEKRGVVF